MIKKGIKVAILTLLTYLLQVTVPPLIKYGSAPPNIALAVLAVVTVALGRKYIFLMSVAVGYLYEVMMPSMQYLNMLLYPICCMVAALFFADKSERKREEERVRSERPRPQLDPHLRGPLAAILSTVIYETVWLLYIYLTGVTVDSGHILRSVIVVVYTTLITTVIQFPLRKWLGVYKLKRLHTPKDRHISLFHRHRGGLN